MNRTEYSRWNDEPARRPTPPAQPPGWVDPPQHVAPPQARGQKMRVIKVIPPSRDSGLAGSGDGGQLDPDPLTVEGEVEPRVPFSGWESMRDRWDQAGRDPISHRAALIGAVACALVIAVLVILGWLA